MAGAAALLRGCRRCSREERVRESCREGSDHCRAFCHGNAFTRECLKHGVTVKLFLPGGSMGMARPSGSPEMLSAPSVPPPGGSDTQLCADPGVSLLSQQPVALVPQPHCPGHPPGFPSFPPSSLHTTAAALLRVWAKPRKTKQRAALGHPC